MSTAGSDAEDTSAVTPGAAGRRRADIVLRDLTPVAVVSLAVLAIFYTLFFAAGLFVPIIFAAVISIILRPLVRSMAAVGIPHAASALLVVLTMTLALIIGAGWFADRAEGWLESLPQIQYKLEAKFWELRQSIAKAEEAAKELKSLTDRDGVSDTHDTVVLAGTTLLESIFQTTLLSFVQFLITMALTFFFLAQNADKSRLVIGRLPWREHHGALHNVFAVTQKTLTRYLQVSAIIYLSLGALTAMAMWMLGMPNPLLWGGLATAFGFMPYVGPIIVFACIAMGALLTFDVWGQILPPPLVYGVLSIIEGYFVTPSILGRYLTITPVAIILSMLLWTWLWGIPGAFLAVPILVIAVTVYHQQTLTDEHGAPTGILVP